MILVGIIVIFFYKWFKEYLKYFSWKWKSFLGVPLLMNWLKNNNWERSHWEECLMRVICQGTMAAESSNNHKK